MRQLYSEMLAVWCLLIPYFSYVVSILDTVANEPVCFYAKPELCLKNGSRCSYSDSDIKTVQVYCCNITSEKDIEDYLRNVPLHKVLTGFHVRDSNLSVLNMNIFDRLKNLASLSITDSSILRIGNNFEESHPSLVCLNVSQNILDVINVFMLDKLSGLRSLVFTNNTKMKELPFLPVTRGFIELDFSGNSDLTCKSLVNLTEFVYFHKIQIKQVNKPATICLPPNTYFNKTFYVYMNHIDQVAEIFKNCPSGEESNCSCSVTSLDEVNNHSIAYQALVNCSSRRLTSLPKILPPFTKILDISNNSITSLEGIGNSTYDNIINLYADFNNITSLKPLEGTLFLENFQSLSLTNNKIDEIPRHILTNVFDRSKGRTVLLAKNVLKCLCDTATGAKAWLMKLSDYIPDYNELLTICDESPMKVIDMNSKDYCPAPDNLEDYLNRLFTMAGF